MRAGILWSTILVLSGLSVVYAVNTFLYLTPPNPVKAVLLPIIYGLQHPLFAQNWHLFAPNPIRTNFVLTVRCRTGDAVTPWRDVTTPLLARHHRNRTSTMGRLLRVQQNAVRLAVGLSPDDWRPLICRRDPTHPSCRGRDAPARARREMGRIVLRRVASAACDAAVGRGRAEAVQTRILMHNPPPWSQRQLPAAAGSTRYVTLPWERYEAW